MQKILVTEFLKPLVRRAGTAFGVFLLSVGVGQESVDHLVLGLTAALSIMLDLVLSHWERQAR